MDARRDQVYNALFRVCGERIERITDDRAISVEELLGELAGYNERIMLCGDGAELVYTSRCESRNLTLAPDLLRPICNK